MKKHRSHEFSFNKEPASHDPADTEAHPSKIEEGVDKAHKQPEEEPKGQKGKERSKTAATKEKSKKKSNKEHGRKDTPESQKEKRADIIEQSLLLKKHFEDTPIPHDPQLVARLIVAEHILSLHEQIEKPNKKSSLTTDELTATLDYMGELAEKLEDPSSEVTPDIQEAYETLLALTEQALEHRPSEDVVAKTGDETIINQAVAEITSQVHTGQKELAKQQVTPRANPSNHPLVTLIMAGVTSSLQKTPTHSSPSVDTTSSGRTPDHPTGGNYAHASSEQSQTTLPQSSTTMHFNRLSPAEARSEYLHSVAREHHTVRPFIASTAPIAAIAITSAMRSQEHSPSIHTSNHAPLPIEIALSHLPSASQRPTSSSPIAERPNASVQSYDSIPPPAITPAHTETTPHVTYSAPPEVLPQSVKKLEYLPLQTLLTMADTIPVGYGRYLRKEFEQNNLDREGLIKILKAHAKGRDFAKEYRRQAERFQNLRTTSPEFLHAATSSNDTSDREQDSPKNPNPLTPKEEKPHSIPKPFLSESSAATPFITSKTPASHPTRKWLIVALAACGVLGGLLFFILR